MLYPFLYKTPRTLDEAVKTVLETSLPPEAVNEVAIDLGVAIMSDYIRNKMAPDVLRYESVGYDLKKLCARLCEVKR